ncbi:MAG: hypothetical protein H6Q90_5722 [Deltaproteobacteria bacterium]|nr:hypothetical protein [Deltaproteobacteria bacterium]
MTAGRTALRIGRCTVAVLDAIGRARLARDGIAGRASRLHAACAEIAAIHRLGVRIHGTWPTGPVVIVANHVSYLDAIALAAALPCAPIAKGEVASWPMIGTAASQLGVIFVARDSAWSRVRALRRAHAALRAGVSVVNFPEGTTTDGTKLLPFQRGIFGLARLAGVPVLPVAVRCARELAWHGNAPFIPHYLSMARLAAPELRLELGQPIDPTQFASAEEVAALAHHRIAYMLRDQLESHAAVIRLRVPAPRSNPVLSASHRRIAR